MKYSDTSAESGGVDARRYKRAVADMDRRIDHRRRVAAAAKAKIAARKELPDGDRVVIEAEHLPDDSWRACYAGHEWNARRLDELLVEIRADYPDTVIRAVVEAR